MPYSSYADFLERAPLYAKLRDHLPESPQALQVAVVQHYCNQCKAVRPFRLPGTSKLVGEREPELVTGNVFYIPKSNYFAPGRTIRELTYHCTFCEKVQYTVWVEIDVFGRPEQRDGGRAVVIPEAKWLRKVGQAPPWAPPPTDKHLEKLLPEEDHELLKKGLACESQSYGVGAYAYYRRIIERIIDTLLASIGDLIPLSEKLVYEQALTRAASSTIAKDKIALVKDLLPTTLRPDGLNPLGVLHTALSEGIHEDTDDKCLEYAADIREVLFYLVTQLGTQRESSARFTKSMQKLLDKNRGKTTSES